MDAMPTARFLSTAAALAVLLAGCAGPRPAYDPGVTAADFEGPVTNPFFPLKPGSRWTYSAGDERVEVEVLSETRTIMGVTAVVVHDVVMVSGTLKEDTHDWYAQDRAGNVWYLGEDTKEYEGGRIVSRDGSWEWGVDGALPGIVMKAHPVADEEPYFQEFYWEEAVDEAAVVALGRTEATPAGSYSDTVTTREWTRLEPGLAEEATYARGVGLVLKKVTSGPATGEREELTSASLP